MAESFVCSVAWDSEGSDDSLHELHGIRQCDSHSVHDGFASGHVLFTREGLKQRQGMCLATAPDTVNEQESGFATESTRQSFSEALLD
jgi:hypothetical protein